MIAVTSGEICGANPTYRPPMLKPSAKSGRPAVRPGGPLFYALGPSGAMLLHNGFLREVTYAPPADAPASETPSKAPSSLCSSPAAFRAGA